MAAGLRGHAVTVSMMAAETTHPEDVWALALRNLVAGGHPTSDTITAVESLARAYGRDVRVVPSWSSFTLVDAADRPLRIVDVAPLGVNMAAVTATLATMDAAASAPHPPPPADLAARLTADAARPPYPTWLFALAAATGATALAVIFGAVRPSTYLFVPVAAALGAVLRRFLGRRGVGLIGQAFGAALIGGLAGALSVQLDLTSPARLVAVCPAMVLVPGLHLLNATLDLAARRMTMGLGRLAYGSLIVLAICAGLLLGLAPGGDLPVTAAGLSVALWLDVPAAMVAAASYPIYFSLNARLIIWPVLVGGLAHAMRWFVVTDAGWGVVAGGFVACLIAGALLGPVARRHGASFAGVGFAAVVALVPGVYVFRGVSGLLDLTVAATADTTTAVAGDLSAGGLTLVAMAIGLVAGQALTAALRPLTRVEVRGGR